MTRSQVRRRDARPDVRRAPRPTSTPTTSPIEQLDAAFEDRALVSGSIPPLGVDLDLIVRRPEREIAASVLTAIGFVRRGPAAVPTRRRTEQWVRFRGAEVDVVDLNPAERWELPRTELSALFSEGVPIEGLTHLGRPSPAHTLLLLARRSASEGTITPKHLTRASDSLRRDPFAWDGARARARDWHAQEALERLFRASTVGLDGARSSRLTAVLGRVASTGPRSLLGGAVSELRARRPRAPKVVAFSGLDGSGKSSQVQALEETLHRLGVAAVVEWKPLGHNASVRALRRTLKRLVAVARGLPVSDLEAVKAPGRSLIAGPDPLLLRRQNPLLTEAWATLVAIASAAHYRSVVLRSMGTGRVVIFDRYALDTVAQVRFFYGEHRDFRLQRALVKAICPRPALAILLEIQGEVALARKPEQYDLPQLETQARLLHEESIRMGVHAVDGSRPLPAICEDVARAVWRSLR
jgi:thymidylate kinase